MVRVVVPIAQGSEELEAVTIVDLLRRAQIEVVVAGLHDGPIRCARGTVLVPDQPLDAVLTQDFDMVILPGGQPGATNLENDPRVISLLQKMVADGKYAAAICAAPKVLAVAGVLDGKSATGFPGSMDTTMFPKVRLQSGAVVRDGKIVTSRGPGTAMDFALMLIELLVNRATRDKVENGLVRGA